MTLAKNDTGFLIEKVQSDTLHKVVSNIDDKFNIIVKLGIIRAIYVVKLSSKMKSSTKAY